MGLMDKFFLDGEIPLIETNRGCPFRCSFCQQGEDYFSKVIDFPIEVVISELNYIANMIGATGAKISALEIADANFGMYRRDYDICKHLRFLQDKQGYPKSIGCSTGKNKPEVILENISLLEPGTIILRSAIQSMNPETLDSIRRSNIKLSAYRSIQIDMESRGLDNCADLMLGLPNETLDTHIKSILDLIDFGIKEFSCLQTIILSGTQFDTKEYRLKHGIHTQFRPAAECTGNYNFQGKETNISEYEEVITSTSSLSQEGYLKARRAHLIVMLFHNSRLLDPVYKYLETLGIEKSKIIYGLICSANIEFNSFINEFLDETKNELSHTAKEAMEPKENVDNKIFKYFSIGFFLKNKILIDTLNESLAKVIGQDNQNIVDELCDICDLKIISPNLVETKSVHITSLRLRRIFGSHLKLIPSEYQVSTIQQLTSQLKSEKEILSKLAYRLRPTNMTLRVHRDSD